MTPGTGITPSTSGPGDGLVFVACDFAAGAPSAHEQPHDKPERRDIVVNGKRVRTVDIHAHCAVPKALALMGQELGGPGLRADLDMTAEIDLRLKTMDEQGIDVEALSINPNWYRVGDRDLAGQIIELQNQALAEACAANPDRFVAFASVALQFPALAAEQLAAMGCLPAQ